MAVAPPVRILVSAPVYPTESIERVAGAVHALFPDARLAPEGARVAGEVPDPAVLGAILQRLRIPDTGRGQLMKGRAGARSVVFLNKQAAATGRLNFAVAPGPLGDIRLELVAATPEALEAFILQAAPDTTTSGYRDPGGKDPDLSRPGSPYSARRLTRAEWEAASREEE